MRTLRIATRASDLALAQARFVASLLEERLEVSTALVSMTTTGDRLAGPLSEAGGKGLFIKEVEESLLEGTADLAVHSAKDLPAVIHSDLELCAFPERADPRDALVARSPGATLADLPRGARVGTGSVRRTAQLLRARPDLTVVPLRGNVPTRLRKLEEENLDAVILACAGLERLDCADRISERISPDVLLPAVTQGVLALETRRGDPDTRGVGDLDDAMVSAAVSAERGFLVRVGGDCGVPMAAHAEHGGAGLLRVRGLVISPDGREVAEAEREVPVSEAEACGRAVAELVLDAGGQEILDGLPGVSPA
ncbi:hydroxymethylbilane synthase [Myxococcota bacterium]|nr:hydroxymethylbilane synthase [Myxococcota bacterium]